MRLLINNEARNVPGLIVYQPVEKEKHAGFKMNPRVKLHFINKLKTK
ncbi:hypothetical protein [Dyadobacter sp. CY326]|nr:hypothetical protein [Dyadobacter sp. CY326]MCE7066736.1 hypothetical protein [Dyadobacter sp. CY326]